MRRAVSYSVSISAHEKGIESEEALLLLQGMPHKSLTPDVVNYSASISVCEKGMQWESTLQLL